jgi:hypothetical protein
VAVSLVVNGGLAGPVFRSSWSSVAVPLTLCGSLPGHVWHSPKSGSEVGLGLGISSDVFGLEECRQDLAVEWLKESLAAVEQQQLGCRLSLLVQDPDQVHFGFCALFPFFSSMSLPVSLPRTR